MIASKEKKILLQGRKLAKPCYGWIPKEGEMSNCEEKQKSKFKNVQKSFQHVLNISLLGEHSFASGAK